MRTSRLWRGGGPRRWTAHGALVLVFGLLISQLVTAHPAVGTPSTPSAPVFRRVAAPNASTGPVVGIAADPAGGGYWLVTRRGRVFPEGPRYWGSVHTTRATGPVVGIAANPKGTGYWLVTSRGHVYALGHTHNWGSAHIDRATGPGVGIAVNRLGNGYWIATSRGHIFALGHTHNWGSAHTNHATGPIAGIAGNPTGTGYWLVTKLGRVHAYGAARPADWVRVDGRTGPVVGVAADPAGGGYWAATANADVIAKGSASALPKTRTRLLFGHVAGLSPGIMTPGYWLTTASASVSWVPSSPASSPSLAPPVSPTTEAPLPSPSPPSPHGAPSPPASTSTTSTSSTGVAGNPTVSVPATIPNNCEADATSQLNSFLSSLPADTTVNFPADACYSVSPDAADLFTIRASSGLTLNGNGSIFKQSTYLQSNGNNACGTNTIDPVLTLYGDTDVSLTNLTLQGPVGNGQGYDCQGYRSEGDNGIYIGNHTGAQSGSNNIIFSAVTVQDINGDGLDVYPDLINQVGVNQNIVFQDGVIRNWGWFAVVPEGVDGLNLTGSTFTSPQQKGFMDVEVDNTCATPWLGGCLTSGGTLKGDGVWNMLIANDTISAGAFLDAEGAQGCIPEHDWTISRDSFAGAGAQIALDGSYGNPECPDDNKGLAFTDNTGAGGTSSCGGSNCAGISVVGWANVDISNNNLAYPDGTVGAYQTLDNATLTSGSSTIHSSSASFTSADACNICHVNGPGIPYGTLLSAVINATTALMSRPATTSGSNVAVEIGRNANDPDKPLWQAVGLCSVTGARIANNDFGGASALWDSNKCFLAGISNLPTTGVSTCGNIWSLTNPFGYYFDYGGGFSFYDAPPASPTRDSAC